MLGTGETAWRMLWALDRGNRSPFAVDVNGGFTVGGVSREVSWASALTFAATPRISLIGELMGRHFDDLTRVSDVYQPHPVLDGASRRCGGCRPVVVCRRFTSSPGQR